LFLNPSYFIDEKGKRLGIWKCPIPAYPSLVDPDTMTERLLTQNFISTVACMFRRQLALKAGGMDDSTWYAADWDLWLKLSTYGHSLYYPHPLSEYRLHCDAQTIRGSKHIAGSGEKELNAVFERHYKKWQASAELKRKVFAAGTFSINIDVALAKIINGEPCDMGGLLKSFFALGPSGWQRYMRDSRILERILARRKILMKFILSRPLK